MEDSSSNSSDKYIKVTLNREVAYRIHGLLKRLLDGDQFVINPDQLKEDLNRVEDRLAITLHSTRCHTLENKEG